MDSGVYYLPGKKCPKLARLGSARVAWLAASGARACEGRTGGLGGERAGEFGPEEILTIRLSNEGKKR
jgi:hypothetical protein